MSHRSRLTLVALAVLAAAWLRAAGPPTADGSVPDDNGKTLAGWHVSDTTGHGGGFTRLLVRHRSARVRQPEQPATGTVNGPIRVNADGRHFVDRDRRPFFWLGDTAWPLFAQYTREQAEAYLANRGRKVSP